MLQQRYKDMKKSTKIGLGIGIQDEKAWDKKLVIKKNKSKNQAKPMTI